MTAFVKLTRWLRSWREVPSCETCKYFGLIYKLTPACWVNYRVPVPLSRIDSPRSSYGKCGPRGKLHEPKVTP
jgi:hypothetical protein